MAERYFNTKAVVKHVEEYRTNQSTKTEGGIVQSLKDVPDKNIMNIKMAE